MSRFLLARTALVGMQYANSLAMYWFVFGLWPKSFPLFFALAGVSIVVLVLHAALDKEKKDAA